jgi:formate hydrogenlyase subunit 3/multisubunit Na+/H+ antiporter MnhD subunit
MVSVYNILGIISLGLAGLMGYWLMSPSPKLAADPLNSLALIIFLLVFLAVGIFLLLYGYMLTDDGE